MRTIFERVRMSRFSRPRIWSLAVAAVALGAVGVALADPGPASVSSVSATFTAAPVGTPNVETCTAANGNVYQFTTATYSGNASGTDPNLTGTIRLDVRSVYDTTTNLGWLRANVQIESSTAGDHADGHLTAVNVAGNLQGFVSGHEGARGGRLLANISASFTSSGGFGSGELGAGTATNTAIATSGNCMPPGPPHPAPPHPVPPHPVTPHGVPPHLLLPHPNPPSPVVGPKHDHGHDHH